MVEDFDPKSIEDEGVRQVVISLMNLVEQLSAKVAEQAEEIQRLRDENNRLKGEQGKPKILPTPKRKHHCPQKKNVVSPNRTTKPSSMPRSGLIGLRW